MANKDRKNKKKDEVITFKPEESQKEIELWGDGNFLKLKFMSLFFYFFASLSSLGFFVGAWIAGIDGFLLMASELVFSACFSYMLSFFKIEGLFLASFLQFFSGIFHFFGALIDGFALEKMHGLSAVFAFCAWQYICVSESSATDEQKGKDRAGNVLSVTSCMVFVLSLSAKKDRSIVYEVQRTSVFLIIFSFLGQRLLLDGDRNRYLSRYEEAERDKDMKSETS